jgi:hypothetical protein
VAAIGEADNARGAAGSADGVTASVARASGSRSSRASICGRKPLDEGLAALDLDLGLSEIDPDPAALGHLLPPGLDFRPV